MILEQFEKELIDIFNKYQDIPFEVKRYVVLKFSDDVEIAYQKEKIKQLLEEQKGEKVEDV